MGAGIKWWWSPAALLLLLLLGVLTLVEREPAAGPERAGPRSTDASPAGVVPGDQVIVRDASGRRAQLGLAPTQALILSFPDELRGQRVTMQVFRRIDGEREVAPWLTLTPRVRADGTIPMAGMAAGDYVVEVTHGDVALPPALVTAPGRHAFGLATPPR